ncbi:MAG: hypothetical protein P8I55_11240 [Crocinitomix sp.]|nr:hypothetical protein [Crocinitomix sp.]
METKKTFLNFYKLVLENMKFDKQLFWKEYQKAIRFLDESEISELNNWIYKNGKDRSVSTK